MSVIEKSRFFQAVDEKRAVSGVAAGFYMKDSSGKYSILLPLETVPSIASTPESIDIDVTTSDVIGKIEGKVTLEEKEVDFFMHRDSAKRLETIKGTQQEFIVLFPDFSGWKFTGTVSYAPQDATSGDPLRGTFKITPTTNDGFVSNVYDLLRKTCLFASIIQPFVELAVGDTLDINIQLSDAAGTFASTSNATGIATVVDAVDKITITAVAAGSSEVTLKSMHTAQASWETTILVIVY